MAVRRGISSTDAGHCHSPLVTAQHSLYMTDECISGV
jgi:hypothetical protein